MPRSYQDRDVRRDVFTDLIVGESVSHDAGGVKAGKGESPSPEVKKRRSLEDLCGVPPDADTEGKK